MLTSEASRRTLLLGAAALSAAACAKVDKVLSDADTLAAGVTAVLPAIKAITGMTDAVFSRIQAADTALTAALHSLNGSAGTSVASQVTGALSAISTALTGFTVPPWVNTVLQAAITAAPYILQLAGVALAPPAAPLGGMSYTQSMHILAASAGVSQ